MFGGRRERVGGRGAGGGSESLLFSCFFVLIDLHVHSSNGEGRLAPPNRFRFENRFFRTCHIAGQLVGNPLWFLEIYQCQFASQLVHSLLWLLEIYQSQFAMPAGG